MRHSAFAPLLTMCVATVAQSPPPNDTCAGALPVSNGTFGPFDNFGATQGAPAWLCPGNYDVWFLYLAGGSGTLSVSTCGSVLDTVLEIFDGTSGCGALTSLGCNDDGCAPGSSLSVAVASGPHWIRVGGFGSGAPAQGFFNLQVNGPAAGASVAFNTSLGAGCGDRYGSIYEQFDYLSFDLANTTLTWQLTNSGYVVTRSAGAQIVPPTGAAVAIVAPQQLLPLPAPMPVPGGSVTALNVTTAGLVELGSAASTLPLPAPEAASLLAWPTAVFACWHNFLPVPVGAVTFEIVGGTAHATWNGVLNTGLAQSTFQFQFELATGDVRLAIVNVSVWGHPSFVDQPQCVVGYSPAGPSFDPGERDLSTLTSIALAVGPDMLPLGVIGTTRPRLGTTWGLAASNVPPSAFVGFDVFGHTDPGIANLAAIGMPGCGLRSSLDLLVAWPSAGASHTYSLAIPNTASLAGVRIFSTSAVLTSPPVNALGILTANGVEGLLGVL